MRRSIYAEERLRKETLSAIKTSEDRGHIVWSKVLVIVTDKEIVAKEKASKTPSTKMIAAYEKIIEQCKDSIKENMEKLGANEECIAELMKYVDNSDTDNAQILLLKLLVKRNPGMFSRKLAACESRVNQK